MDEVTSGLILRTRPLTETSLIVEWLTADLGRFSTVAKGARRRTSPFSGKLDLYYLATMSFARSQRSDLHQLREVKVLENHEFLRRDIGSLQRAAYCGTLLEQMTEKETPLPDYFRLMLDLLHHLGTKLAGHLLVAAFEVKLLVLSGLSPAWETADITSGSRQLLRVMCEQPFERLGCLQVAPSQWRELDRLLQTQIESFCGKIPRGRDIAIVAS